MRNLCIDLPLSMIGLGVGFYVLTGNPDAVIIFGIVSVATPCGVAFLNHLKGKQHVRVRRTKNKPGAGDQARGVPSTRPEQRVYTRSTNLVGVGSFRKHRWSPR